MGRTVVITRPIDLAQEWIDAFKERGHHVQHIPLLRITATKDLAPIKEAWRNIEQWDWVMFVSRNAVHYFFQQANQTPWPDQLRVGSPGEGTSQALLELGVYPSLIDQPQEHQEKDTEFLWQNIKDRNWLSARVLLVRGTSNKPPRDWFMEQLQDAGAFVQPLVVYQRESGIFSNEAQNWVISEQARQAYWIISSTESLCALEGHDWSQAIAIVIHPRIAQAVRQIGFKHVICVQPDLNTLINSVESVV